jgi:magnesium chelatase subunit I
LLWSLFSASDPEDPELMSEEVRNRVQAGENLPVGRMKIPMIDLPLGATEDRVCGTIDIEKALTEGKRGVGEGRCCCSSTSS